MINQAIKVSRFERVTNLMVTLMRTSQMLTMTELVNQIPGYLVDGDPAGLRATFERDKRILREIGIAVRAAGIDDDVASRYYLERIDEERVSLSLDREEKRSLARALSLLHWGSKEERHAMVKLSDEGDSIAQSSKEERERLTRDLIELAISSRRSVRTTYRGRTVDVEPYGLVEIDQGLALVGRDQHVEGCRVRSYCLALMDEIPTHGSSAAFELPAVFDPTATFDRDADHASLSLDEVEDLAAISNRAVDAGDRVHRLLAILAYLEKVGNANIASLARRFQMRISELVLELELAACFGSAPFTPDLLLDLIVSDSTVSGFGLAPFAVADGLTRGQAIAALKAARFAAQMPTLSSPALRSAIRKLEQTVDVPVESAEMRIEWSVDWAVALRVRVGEVTPFLERLTIDKAKVSSDGASSVLAYLADRRWRTPLLRELGLMSREEIVCERRAA